MRIDDEARKALEELAELWLDQQATYPRDFGGSEAAAAVRCCSKELASLLSRCSRIEESQESGDPVTEDEAYARVWGGSRKA